MADNMTTFGDEELTESVARKINKMIDEGITPDQIIVNGKTLVINR